METPRIPATSSSKSENPPWQHQDGLYFSQGSQVSLTTWVRIRVLAVEPSGSTWLDMARHARRCDHGQVMLQELCWLMTGGFYDPSQKLGTILGTRKGNPRGIPNSTRIQWNERCNVATAQPWLALKGTLRGERRWLAILAATMLLLMKLIFVVYNQIVLIFLITSITSYDNGATTYL